MGLYSIKDLENLSGIKAHTLRIWEQRYNIITPKRTDTNIRLYDDTDLKFILNISLLREYGYKISQISLMSEIEVKAEVVSLTEKNIKFPDQIQTLTIAMIDLDEERFEKVIALNILQLGFEQTMVNIIYPFLHKIGVLWMTGSISPAQEHFISNLIRQKIIVAIDGQPNHWNNKTKKFMLFLPEGELHEISLLFANYMLRSRQQKVIYLGQSLPFADLESAFEKHRPDYIFTILTSFPSDIEAQKYIAKLKDRFIESKILLTGYRVTNNNLIIKSPNVIVFEKFNQLVELIETF